MRGPRCGSHTTLLPFSPSSISHRTIHVGMKHTTGTRHNHTPAQPTHPWVRCITSFFHTHTQTCTHEHHKHLFTPHTHNIDIAIHQHTYTFTHKDTQSQSYTCTCIREDTHTYGKSEPFHLIPSIIILAPYPPHFPRPHLLNGSLGLWPPLASWPRPVLPTHVPMSRLWRCWEDRLAQRPKRSQPQVTRP